jgi:hypothetical protein
MPDTSNKHSNYLLIVAWLFYWRKGGTMKLKIRKSIITSITIIMSIVLFSFPAWSTNVGGIIKTDTVWDLSGSPYTIIETVQVAEGVALIIEPGVVVNGTVEKNSIEVWGTIKASGSQSELIRFNEVNIIVRGSDALIDIKFSHFSGGIPYTGQHGVLLLRDSILQNTDHIYLGYPREDSYIERNVFIRSGVVQVLHSGPSVYIRNNVFMESEQIVNANASSGMTIVAHNSFLSTDRVAVKLPLYHDQADIIATNNYWNTTEADVIESMIYDKNDDLNCANYIAYMPFLTEPHADTPSLPFALANFTARPTSGVYPLTASFTDNSFGAIESWNWDFGDDAGSTEQNPTHTYVDPGKYTVSLTVKGAEVSDTKTRMVYITVSKVPSPPTPPIQYIAVRAGGYLPEGDLHDDFEGRVGADIVFGHYFNPRLALEGGIGLFNTKGDVRDFNPAFGTFDQKGEVSVTLIFLTLKRVHPIKIGELYLGGGIGLYFADIDVDINSHTLGSGSLSGSDTVPGIHLLAGANFNITDYWFLGLEGKYMITGDVSVSDTVLGIPFDREYNLNGINITGVVGFRF